MRKFFLVKVFGVYLMCSMVSSTAFAGMCVFSDDEIGRLNDQKFGVQYHIKVPIPNRMIDALNRFFGDFSEKDCRDAFTATKIIDRSNQEYYLAYYTNQDICDGGNSYGVILKGSDKNIQRPYALIEDSYIDCYVLK